MLATVLHGPRDVRYEDVRDKIRQQLGEQLAVRRYLDTLRKKAYIDVRS